MEPTWFVLFGLGFDIAGAFLIVEPILTRFVRIDPRKQQGAPTGDYRDKAQTEPDYEHKTSNQAWFGFGFLAFGFLLQFIGTWLKNPPI